ncbi:hypothetical protein JZU68_10480 [bacterium]|jgi:hypothetical protein|nr:hypothetical protein [bacterium]
MVENIRNKVGVRYVARHVFSNTAMPEMYIVDWKDINGGDVQIHTAQPTNPDTGDDVNGVYLTNTNEVDVTFDALADNALFYTKANQSRQCECVCFPTSYSSDEWMLFVETKYANNLYAALRPENDYPNRMVDQIKQTVTFFRTKEIIPTDKLVNAIVSFPNLLDDFNAFVFPTTEIEDMLIDHNILIRATNEAEIVSDVELNLIA